MYIHVCVFEIFHFVQQHVFVAKAPLTSCWGLCPKNDNFGKNRALVSRWAVKPACPECYWFALHSSHSPVWVKVMLLNSFSNQVFVVRSGVGTLFSFICPQLINKLQPFTFSPTCSNISPFVWFTSVSTDSNVIVFKNKVPWKALFPIVVTLGRVMLLRAQSMGFSRQEYWSGLPFSSPGDLPNPGIKPRSPALQADATSTY